MLGSLAWKSALKAFVTLGITYILHSHKYFKSYLFNLRILSNWFFFKSDPSFDHAYLLVSVFFRRQCNRVPGEAAPSWSHHWYQWCWRWICWRWVAVKTTVLCSLIQCLTVMSIVSMSETGPAIMLKSILNHWLVTPKKLNLQNFKKKVNNVSSLIFMPCRIVPEILFLLSANIFSNYTITVILELT